MYCIMNFSVKDDQCFEVCAGVLYLRVFSLVMTFQQHKEQSISGMFLETVVPLQSTLVHMERI